MRKHPTEAEAILWGCLRAKRLGPKFRRQYPMLGYIVDFYSIDLGLIVEVDGPSWHDPSKDAIRDEAFAKQGIRTLRFRNDQVITNLPFVRQRILDEINDIIRLKLGRP